MQQFIGQTQHALKAAEARLSFRRELQCKVVSWDKHKAWRGDDNTKLIHFIRHGQGYHNLLGEVSREYGAVFSETGEYEIAVNENCPYMLPSIQDPPLTATGRHDAKLLRPQVETLDVELLVTSALRRASETMLIGFHDILQAKDSMAFIAHEGCREQCGVFLCDKRSDISDYKEDLRYSLIDYSLIPSDEDGHWKPTERESMLEMSYRAEKFFFWLLHERPEREIVVGTHSAWLMAVFNVVLDTDSATDTAGNSCAEKLQSMFATGEMRSVLLSW